MNNIIGVYELTECIKSNLESNFNFVWVKGEITNLTRASSGHIYFSLKEKDALLNCVWFSHNQNSINKLTGEVSEVNVAKGLKDGQQIVLTGKISVYSARGSYQLYVEYVEAVGLGQLYMQLEAIKAKLLAEGLLDEKRKRQITRNPKKIALITAKTGAVIQDFLKIASRRGLSTCITLYSTLVQGEDAAKQIIQAINTVNIQNKVELIVLIRGGGSLEDLMAFNDEALARAIAGSNIPVLTGIGHESDITIAGLVADKNAATPSHAAQLLWSEKADFIQAVDEYEEQINKQFSNFLDNLQEKINTFKRTINLLSPINNLLNKQNSISLLEKNISNSFKQSLDNKQNRVDLLVNNIETKSKFYLQKLENNLAILTSKLVDPYLPLEKGYTLVYDGDNLVARAEDIKKEQLAIQFYDKKIKVQVI